LALRRRTRVSELADDLIREYRINGRKSTSDLQARWNLHLKVFFGVIRAVDVSSGLLARYVDARQQEKAKNATINRELAALKRMFHLGQKATPPKVVRSPQFPHLEERNVRTGFLTDEQYAELAKQCATVALWLRAMLEVAYTYGWRVEELKSMRVRQVDLAARVIRLEPGTTKNRDGREVTITDSLYILLSSCAHGERTARFPIYLGGW
jgi:integrase